MLTNSRIKINGRRAILVWLLALLFSLGQGMVGSAAYAQSQTATGTVVSKSDGQPLPGVAVLVKGTTVGTITDFDGKFNLQADNGVTLVFSFLGFKTQENVFSGAPLNVVLDEESTDLEDVVVVGYGVQKKKLVTGATVQVKGDDVQKLNTNNALQALQGQTPGVTIQSTSGQPGSAMNVSIRGLGTVGNSQPLYLIDGIGGDITTLNPADIESIDVLKEAASAAIYGAQAANGVVLVTTKSGKEGKGVVSYDGYYGIQNVYRKNPALNATEYMAIMNEASLNSGASGIDWLDSKYSDLINEDGTSKYDTNWLDEIISSNAITQSHNLSITGGSKTTNYAMSLGYMGQEGVIGGSQVSNYDRFNFRINSEAKLYDGFLTVGEHVGIVWKEQRGMGTGNIYNNNIRGAYVTSPLTPVYDEDGNYFSAASESWNVNDGNPVGTMMLNRFNRTKNFSVDANVYAQIEPIKNLKIKTVYGISYGGSEYRSYTPIYTSKDGYHGFSMTSQSMTSSKVSESRGNGISQVWQNTASYDFTIADEHDINVLIGTEMSKYDGGSNGGSNTDLITGFNDWSHAYLSNTEGTENKTVSGAPYDSTRGASYFARLGWNWNEKYMLNATFRADGSSKFSKDSRFGFFPSVSAGWTFSEESFMDATRSVLDFAKLRLSWGQVGNANINCYQYLAPVSTDNTTYNFGTGGGQSAWTTGSYTSRLANADVKWETSEQLNIGLDLRLLESRLSATIDWYRKTTKDWLV